MGEMISSSMNLTTVVHQSGSAGNTAAWNRTSVNKGQSQREQLADVAKEYEALFLTEFLKQARAGELSEGLFSSEAGKTFQGMLDVEMARASSRNMNLGIADAMVTQLGRGLPKAGE